MNIRFIGLAFLIFHLGDYVTSIGDELMNSFPSRQAVRRFKNMKIDYLIVHKAEYDMFAIAILIGIYSYCIFALGLLGLLYPVVIFVFSIFFLVLAVLYFRKNILGVVGGIREIREAVRRDMLSRVLLLFLAALVVVNLVGALGPELAFDALWYHLTLPKLYLLNHAVVFIPGGLLYYSAIPKLTEMLYTAALAIDSEILAKCIHFVFGLLTIVAIYKFSRLFLSLRASLIAAAIFYANLVVAWESTTAYIDLARTFFEIMALWAFILWVKKDEKKWLIESAVMVGLAVTTKLLAFGSLAIFCTLIIWYGFIRGRQIKESFLQIGMFLGVSLLIPLPWFVFSLIHTSNPVYPFFTKLYETTFDIGLLNPFVVIWDIWYLFTKAADPISPLYIIALPMLVIFFRKLHPYGKIIALYSFLALIIWYITPRTGGGRFILPYLPAFSILVASFFEGVDASGIPSKKIILRVMVWLVVVTCLISFIYRGVANVKYIPVIFGFESKKHFLLKNLNFSYGDFYDVDSYFSKTIKRGDTVLLYGFHNLYYVDFPFIDSSWVQKGDKFQYIAVQNSVLPKRFRYWNMIYYNPITKVALYTVGEREWIY